ncbi:transposase, partial [Staphylococcus aureus]
CSLRHQCMKPNSKSNKKIMKNYNWEYFKAQINQKLSEPETKKIYSQRKIDVEPVFGFMKAILGFTRMSVRGINKVKRELGLRHNYRDHFQFLNQNEKYDYCFQ